jgi:hypothetical protein
MEVLTMPLVKSPREDRWRFRKNIKTEITHSDAARTSRKPIKQVCGHRIRR